MVNILLSPQFVVNFEQTGTIVFQSGIYVSSSGIPVKKESPVFKGPALKKQTKNKQLMLRATVLMLFAAH